MAVFYGGSLFYVLTALLVSLRSAHALQRVAHHWARFHRGCARIILQQKIQVIGNLPDGPYLYVFKHESMFETIDLLVMFRRPAVAAKRELADIPLWGRVAVLHGIIPVEREAGASALRAMMKASKQALADGRPICLFPEGTRVLPGQCPPLQAGFAGLYKLLGVPVIPVALNSGQVSPRKAFIKRPGTVTYLVGDTIPPGLPRAEAELRVHAAINALNDAR